MNEIDPAAPLFPGRGAQVRRPSRRGQGEPAASTRSPARSPRNIAATPCRPVMVSGVLRLVEFGCCSCPGIVLYRHLCRLRRRISPGSIRRSSSVGSLLDGGAARIHRLLPDLGAAAARSQMSGRMLLVWSGAFAVLALTGFFLKVSSRFLAPVVRQLVRHRLRAAVRPQAGDVADDPALGAQRHAWSAAPSSSAAARRPRR